MESKYPITTVSGFWKVTNKHNTSFTDSWLSKALKINCPYVIFSEEKDMEMLKMCRGNLPTHIFSRSIPDFVTYKYYDAIQTHPRHVPSKELQCIWNEKLFLLREAMRLNPYNSEWFLWNDAGIFLFRERLPPPTPFYTEKVNSLPKDKLIFSSSDSPFFEPEKVKEGNYYHFVSGIFMLHKDFLETFVSIFEKFCEKLLSQKDWIYTDQVILTHMYKEHPDMFHCIGHDYGRVITWLYEPPTLTQ